MSSSAHRPGRTGEVIGLLDVGTAKTACLVVSAPNENVRPLVLGAGVRATRGLKAGVVVEMDGVEQAIRGAVSDAERSAGLRLGEVSLAVSCGRLRAHSFQANAAILKQAVGQPDIERLLQAGRAFAQRDGRTLLDLRFLGFRIDGAPISRSVHGLEGRQIDADVMAITADEAPLRNMVHVLERAGLGLAGLVPSPWASGLAATSAEDRQAGVFCLDLGAGTTQLAMFAHGHLLSCDVLPVGGNHITFDIARALSAPLSEAERIKRAYGTLSAGAEVDAEGITYTLAGPAGQHVGADLYQTTAGHVRQVIEARVASLLALVAERIERTALPQYAQSPMILTGGASVLPGLAQMAEHAFARPVQLALMQPLEGLPEGVSGPAYATVVGMALVPPGLGVSLAQAPGARAAGGYLQRMGQWLRGSN